MWWIKNGEIRARGRVVDSEDAGCRRGVETAGHEPAKIGSKVKGDLGRVGAGVKVKSVSSSLSLGRDAKAPIPPSRASCRVCRLLCDSTADSWNLPKKPSLRVLSLPLAATHFCLPCARRPNRRAL